MAGTMLATSLAFYVVATSVLKWRRAVALPLVALFVLVFIVGWTSSGKKKATRDKQR